MEIAFYEYAKSVKITGDAAIVFYMNEGKVFTKNLSYLMVTLFILTTIP